MTRRSRIVAAQTVLVAVLSVIVVLTLLRPDGDNSLFGVDPPHTDEPAANPAEQQPDPAEPDNGGEPQRRPPATALQGAPRPGTATTVQSADSAAAPGNSAPTRNGDAMSAGGGSGVEAGDEGQNEDGGDSPTDDQYSDTATRIALRLGQGS